MNSREPITFIGRTNARHLPHKTFGIKQSDKFFHSYVIGKTGTGKSTLLETMAAQDIAAGRGVAVLDPHGDMVTRLVARVPKERLSDLVYLDAPNPLQPYGYNPLRKMSLDKVPLAASGLLDAFKKIWVNEWGVRMEHILRNALFALLEYGSATLPDILRLITDQTFRRAVILKITNEAVRTFWLSEFPKYNPRYRQEAIAPIQNKIGAFLADPRLHRMLTSPKQDIRIREIMDKGKIFLVNLSKGALGDDSAGLLGALLVSTMSLAAFSRVDTPEDQRRDFAIFIDECQEIMSLSVANMISELRKFKIALTLGNQHLSQLEPDVRHAILGNVGTLIAFRIGPEDAAIITKEFEPTFASGDLINLPNHQVVVKLLIDRSPSRPFSADTLTPEALAEHLYWGR